MRPPMIPQSIPIYETDSSLSKTLKTCYNHLVEHREPGTGRILISLFMCLPSRKKFPEYFDIIDRPISMYEIRKRIENLYYKSELDCIADLKLMFNNCRLFNEDLSQIFHDAVILEEMLLKKFDSLYKEQRPSQQLQHHNYQQTTTPPTTATTQHQPRTNSTINSSTPKNHRIPARPPKTNGVARPLPTQLPPPPQSVIDSGNSNSNSHSIGTGGPVNRNEVSSFIIDHDFHNDTSLDSNSNLSIQGPADTSAATASSVANPKPTKRLKRDPDAPKKRLLTGYIIYAAEVRKDYVDNHPNQDFGFVSRLIGHDWKALPMEARRGYEQRAMAHNKKLQEKILRDSMLAAQTGQPHPLTNGTSTPKLSKRKMAKMATQPQTWVTSTPGPASDSTTQSVSATTETATQTARLRFVKPPERRQFLDYLDDESSPCERPLEPEKWLGAGIGRHESAEAALWALRDFMLLDTETRRWNMQPYLTQ